MEGYCDVLLDGMIIRLLELTESSLFSLIFPTTKIANVGGKFGYKVLKYTLLDDLKLVCGVVISSEATQICPLTRYNQLASVKVL